jgi:hypothetical protein
MKTVLFACFMGGLFACAGCDTSAGDLARNTVSATARSWCGQASNCDADRSRDPLAERPAWDRTRGTATKRPLPR